MAKIEQITKQTENPFVNLYLVEGKNKVGRPFRYYVASRAKSIERMKIKTRKNIPDGVIMYSLWGEKKDHVVLVRQYRVSIDDFIYEFPAGLVEKGEDVMAAGIREFHEETGLRLEAVPADDMFTLPRFTTIGMTDESCATVYGYASGTPDSSFQETSEDIQIVLADREEVRRILKEENVALMCAYMLMHFLNAEGDPLEFIKKR